MPPIRKLPRDEFPPLLAHIPDPPDTLYARGSLPDTTHTLIAVVGSRKYSTYGKQVVEHIISGLRGYPVGIISGLALGIDSLAHRAALEQNLYTLAVPGGGLNDDVLYPRAHVRLAEVIIAKGGGLLSEYEPSFRATHWSFPRRNRIVTGMAHATLIIEATEQSGTLISARLATDYNRELFVVPGSIFSENSAGCHQFLKLGATPVTSARDILDALSIEYKPQTEDTYPTSPDEAHVLQILSEPRDRDTLIRTLALPTDKASILLMQMEMEGRITEEYGIFRRTSQ